jgi:hypothetical protein
MSAINAIAKFYRNKGTYFTSKSVIFPRDVAELPWLMALDRCHVRFGISV